MAQHRVNPLRPRRRPRLTTWRKPGLWRQQLQKAAAEKVRAEEVERIRLLLAKRSREAREAEISRKNDVAHQAAQAQANLASKVPLSLRPAYPKHKISKAVAWTARIAHGGGLATGMRAEESRERLRAAMHRWQLRRAQRRLTD